MIDMKILIINRQYHTGGGAEVAVRGLAEMLNVQGGHEVTVLSLRNKKTAQLSGSLGASDLMRNSGLSTNYNHKVTLEKKQETAPFGTASTSANVMQIPGLSSVSNDNIPKNPVKVKSILKEKTVEVGGFAPPDPWMISQGPHCVTPTAGVYFQMRRILSFCLDCLNVITPVKIFLLIKKYKFDVIHTHNLRGMGMLSPIAIRAARLQTKFRWFHTLHDIQLAVPSGVKMFTPDGIRLSFAEKIYSNMQCWIWGSPDVVISPSRFLLNFYRIQGFFKKSRVSHIPNIIPLPLTHPLSKEEPERKTILFVGVLEASKGITILLEAYLMLLQKHPDFKHPLEIVGSGSLFGALKEKYKSNKIFFRGGKTSDELSDLYSCALVTVVPSLTYENAPTVIYESMRHGVPVIASRIGGIPELITQGVNGWLVEPGDIEELQTQLEDLSRIGTQEIFARNCIKKSIDIGTDAIAQHALRYALTEGHPEAAAEGSRPPSTARYR